jgi:transposase
LGSAVSARQLNPEFVNYRRSGWRPDDYNLLFRWFVGLGINDGVWDHSTSSKNRDRLLNADVATKFLEAMLRHPKVKRFLSDDHFSVDAR